MNTKKIMEANVCIKELLIKLIRTKSPVLKDGRGSTKTSNPLSLMFSGFNWFLYSV